MKQKLLLLLIIRRNYSGEGFSEKPLTQEGPVLILSLFFFHDNQDFIKKPGLKTALKIRETAEKLRFISIA